MTHDYWEDHTPDMSSTAAALVRLEVETAAILNDAERLIGRARLAMQKQTILLSAMRKILVSNNGGVMPELPIERRFPELN